MGQAVYSGTVKMFDSGKKFGFLKPDRGAGLQGEVHVRGTVVAGSALLPGERVVFKVSTSNPRGPSATAVWRPLDRFLPLPEDTRAVIRQLLESSGPIQNGRLPRLSESLDSLSQALEKLLVLFDTETLQKVDLGEKPNKHQVLDLVADSSNERAKGFELLKEVRRRQAAVAGAYVERGFVSKELRCQVAWRTVIGIGNASFWETGITLHPILGVPCLPTSALHGLARRGARELGEPKEEEDKTLGGPGRSGHVLFLPAWPDPATLRLHVDVMNPHLRGYHSGDKLPLESELSPAPVQFLTIGTGTCFDARLLSRSDRHLQRAADWLAQGLEEIGIGAKGSAGYGELRVPPRGPGTGARLS